MKYLKPIGLAGVVAALFLNTNLAGGEPFHHPFGELREYHKHWISVCPDVHEPDSNSDYRTNCWASTWTGNEDGTMSGAFPGDRLSVHRNRTTGDMKVTIAAIFVDEIDRSRPVRVKFSGGHRAEYTFGEAFTQHQNFGNEYTFAAGDTTADIIRRDACRKSHHHHPAPAQWRTRHVLFASGPARCNGVHRTVCGKRFVKSAKRM